MERNIVWFSCGAASFTVSHLLAQQNIEHELVYCDTGSEHIDNKRFIREAEQYLHKNVTVLKNEKYENVIDVLRKHKYINGIRGAMCTGLLKKSLRFKYQRHDDIQYFGYTIEEKHRADRFLQSFPEVNAKFPLIEHQITKNECIGILSQLKIEMPIMYKLGYNNNNCIGCVKGGKGYWNKIRIDFPEVFFEMAKLEREVGATCINGVYLDELQEGEGIHKIQKIECDFICQLYTQPFFLNNK